MKLIDEIISEIKWRMPYIIIIILYGPLLIGLIGLIIYFVISYYILSGFAQ